VLQLGVIARLDRAIQWQLHDPIGRSRALYKIQWLLDRPLSRAMTRKLKQLFPGVS
jgi:hypothetical protein